MREETSGFGDLRCGQRHVTGCKTWEWTTEDEDEDEDESVSQHCTAHAMLDSTTGKATCTGHFAQVLLRCPSLHVTGVFVARIGRDQGELAVSRRGWRMADGGWLGTLCFKPALVHSQHKAVENKNT
ncbi:hypothetical protein CFE70_007443 [Pyrenophora teres f. teres 0-1]